MLEKMSFEPYFKEKGYVSEVCRILIKGTKKQCSFLSLEVHTAAVFPPPPFHFSLGKKSLNQSTF